MAYNLEDGTPSFVIEVDFLKGEKGDTGFSPRIEIASLTSAEYILKVINQDGEFLTPNLKSDLSLDDYVLKEEGKGLSTNSFENEEKQKLQELHNYDDTELKSQVSSLTEAIGNINSFDIKVVDELPIENIDVHTIYFVPNEQEDKNYYDEFLYVNSKWEHIGTSKVDLSNYATLQQVEELSQAQQELIDNLGKTYTGTNITAPTVAGWGRINKLYGQTIEEGTGDKSPDNPYTLKCVGDDINLFNANGTINYNTYVSEETGDLVTHSLNDASDYIQISFKEITIQGAIDGDTYALYDINKSYLRGGTFKNKIAINTEGASYIRFTLKKNRVDLSKVKMQKGSVATPYSPYGYGTVENVSTDGTNTSSNIVTAKPLCSIGDVRDELDYTNGRITRKCGYIASYNGESITTDFISSTGELSTGATVIYVLAILTTEDINCSNKIVQYADSTNVYNTDGAEIEVNLTNSEVISDINENIKNVEEKQELSHTYSTEEQVVGTWIDDKPLYRKVIQSTIPSTISTTGTGFEIPLLQSNNINKIWLDIGNSFIHSDKAMTSANTTVVVDVPLIYLTNLTGSYLRTNIQCRYNNGTYNYFAYINTNYSEIANKIIFFTVYYTED